MSWLRNVMSTRQLQPHMRRDRATGVRAKMVETEAKQDPRHNGYTYEFAFDTKLTVWTTFYANDVQFEGRRQLAERAVVEMVFEPYLKRRIRLMHAIMDGNEEEAMELLKAIDAEIGP